MFKALKPAAAFSPVEWGQFSRSLRRFCSIFVRFLFSFVEPKNHDHPGWGWPFVIIARLEIRTILGSRLNPAPTPKSVHRAVPRYEFYSGFDDRLHGVDQILILKRHKVVNVPLRLANSSSWITFTLFTSTIFVFVFFFMTMIAINNYNTTTTTLYLFLYFSTTY